MPGTWGRVTTERRNAPFLQDLGFDLWMVLSLRFGLPVLGTSARAFAPAGTQERGRPGSRRTPAVRPRGSLICLRAGFGVG